jgi:polyhydroxybutyrate depolymerase
MWIRRVALKALQRLAEPIEGETSSGATTHHLTIAGQQRWYELYVPPACVLKTPAPLILAFHGATSTPKQFAYISQLSRRGGETGYVVAYPAAHQGFWSPTPGGTDIAFVDAVLDDVAAKIALDPARIFGAGISNGGQMVYRLACERSNRIAAIAACACGMSLGECRPQRAVPVIHFHGTTDTFVSYMWGVDAVNRWRDINHCESVASETYRNGNAICRTYKDSSGVADVTLCTVEGMGHQWPGVAIRMSEHEAKLLGLPVILSRLGPGTDDLDATGMLLSFFSSHPIQPLREDASKT